MANMSAIFMNFLIDILFSINLIISNKIINKRIKIPVHFIEIHIPKLRADKKYNKYSFFLGTFLRIALKKRYIANSAKNIRKESIRMCLA